MSNAEERGALGKRFHDLPTDTNNPDLSWEAMAANILSPPPEEEPEKRKPLIWWWLTAILLMLATGYYFTNNSSQAEDTTSQEELLVTAPDKESSRTENISAQVEMPGAELSPQENGPVAAHRPSTENSAAPLSNRSSPKGEPQRGSIPINRSGRVLANDDLTEDRLDKIEAVVSSATDGSPRINDPATAPVIREETAYSIISPLNAWPTQLLAIHNEMPSPVVKITDIDDSSSDQGKNLLSLTAGGFTQQSPYSSGAIPEAEVSQSSPQFSLQYSKILSDRWQIGAGIDGRYYRFRTAFENLDENARLYRPGTVDTIFRNVSTGEERIVFTDTIPGTRLRKFGNDNSISELGLSLVLSRRWQFGRHGFLLSAGPRVGLVIGREGRTTNQLNQVSDLVDAPQYGKDLRISGRLEAGYSFDINHRWSFMAQLGAESSLSNWASGTTLTQRPTLLSGSLGIGVKW